MSEAPWPVRGKLLVAAPRLLDPNFSRTVVFLLAHSDQGAVGLVLNRPSTTEVASPLPEWHSLASEPAVVFEGGPVSEGSICLAQVKPQVPVPETGYLPLNETLGTVDLGAGPELVTPWAEQLRIYAGYAGWAPGQLEAEIGEGAWYVVEAAEGELFSGQPDGLWKSVLRRRGGDLALVAAYPPDPSLN